MRIEWIRLRFLAVLGPDSTPPRRHRSWSNLRLSTSRRPLKIIQRLNHRLRNPKISRFLVNVPSDIPSRSRNRSRSIRYESGRTERERNGIGSRNLVAEFENWEIWSCNGRINVSSVYATRIQLAKRIERDFISALEINKIRK